MKDSAIVAHRVSKKYCKSLKRSMLYGLHDVARNVAFRRTQSHHLRDGEFWAVRDVSFSLRRGETLALIGANGSGKTTLLKVLNGILWPDTGQVACRGRTGALIEVGAGFHPLLTGRENIYVNGAILGMKKEEIDRKFDAIVEYASIGDFLDAPVKHYSSGMFVRLGFSVAVHSEPDILLVDEVLAVGDADFRRKSSATMKEFIGHKDRAIVLISHNMQTVASLANRALLLEHGNVTAAGDPDRIIASYEARGSSTEDMPAGMSGDAVGPPDLRLLRKYTSWEDGSIEVSRVWLRENGHDSKGEVNAESDVTICVRYRTGKDIPLRDVYLWTAFVDANEVNCQGSRLPLADGCHGEHLPRAGVLEVAFRPLQLATGRYRVSVHFMDRTFSVPYCTGVYGHVPVLNTITARNPGVNSPVCWRTCDWKLLED